MGELFTFEAKLDRPAVPAGLQTEVKLLITFRSRPGLVLPSPDEKKAMVANICLVFDCSGSMAGQKRETAIEAAKLIVQTVHERHRLSLVGFASKAKVLVSNVSPTPRGKAALENKIDERIRAFPRGTTNLAEGLKKAAALVEAERADARVIIVLSDGGADDAKKARAAGLAASKAGAQLFAVGIGADYDATELLELVTPSNGAVLGEGDLERIKSTFETLIGRIESFVATHASLAVTFGAGVTPLRAYKTSPELAVIGAVEQQQVRLHAGNLERDRAYGFLLAASAAARSAGKVEAARATLSYDVPSLGLKGQRQELTVPLEYTERAQMTGNAEVAAVFRAVQFVELAEGLADAQRRKDAAASAAILAQLIARAGDPDAKAFYEDVLAELEEVGKISQDRLNAVVLGSTGALRKKKRGPQLYDVVLVDPGKQVIVLLRELRALTGMELSQLGELVRSVPKTLKVLPLAEARVLKKQMQELGARAEVRAAART